ncbi:MAG TPA: helix-turn-helix domain-containing protein [Polyangiaceae bacterium]|jgi:AcrR family transcriptional regulator|nr:helix-turn-helix domain-containing protein [Polyangiaceae bacterium]
MGISERRDRERERRRQEILLAAWEVAEKVGWSRFSVEQVAAQAELGRATIYSYFASLDALVVALAEEALDAFSKQLAAAPGLTELLDVPVRFAQANRAAYDLLFPAASHDGENTPPADLADIQLKAQQLIRRMQRVSAEDATLGPENKASEAFLAAISMAATVVPELRASTTLRHRWQDFCLRSLSAQSGEDPPDVES